MELLCLPILRGISKFRLDTHWEIFNPLEKSLEFSHKLIRAFTHLSFPFPFDFYSLVVNKERERESVVSIITLIYIYNFHETTASVSESKIGLRENLKRGTT